MAFAALCSGAFADDLSEARKNIESVYSKLDAAFLKNDYRSAVEVYDPDFTTTDKKGNKITLKDINQRLKNYKQHIYKDIKILSQKTLVNKIELNGNQATVYAEAKTVTSASDPATSKKLLCDFDATYVDVWRKKNNVWRVLSKRLISSKVFLNSKQVN